jgi:GH18 family chitinase
MLRFSLRLSLLVLLLVSCSASTTPTQSTVPDVPAPEPSVTPTPTPFRIIAYATEGIFESLIPYEKLTHINYAFLIPNADGTFVKINNGWKLKLIAENAHAHDVSVIISVGGGGWDKKFETVAADPALRSAFVRNLKAFVDEYQLDGADIDWEYPDAGQSAQNFLALIQELRSAMPDKELTTAVVSHGENGMGILPETFELFDFVNVMTYDGPDHGTMQQFEQGLAFWTARGLPKEKIVMGVPFYGDPNLPYFKIVDTDPSAAQTDSFDYFGTTFHYNGIPTVEAKTKIAMQQASGIMFWTLDYDAQGEFSLVNTIYETAHP